MKKRLFVICVAIVALFWSGQLLAQDTIYYDPQVVKTDKAGVIIGTQNLSEKISYSEPNGFYAVGIIVADTLFSRDGLPVKITLRDYVVHMKTEHYEALKKMKGPCYIHAKWTVRAKNGFYYGTTAPTDPNKPGKKVLLVFNFGDFKAKLSQASDKIVDADPQNQPRASKNVIVIKQNNSQQSPCTVTEAQCARLGKKLNIQTCNCE